MPARWRLPVAVRGRSGVRRRRSLYARRAVGSARDLFEDSRVRAAVLIKARTKSSGSRGAAASAHRAASSIVSRPFGYSFSVRNPRNLHRVLRAAAPRSSSYPRLARLRCIARTTRRVNRGGPDAKSSWIAVSACVATLATSSDRGTRLARLRPA